MTREPNLIDKLRDSLPAQARDLFNETIHLAETLEMPAYLVGGPLRDLLLDRQSLDVDISVEGDAMALVRELPKARTLSVAQGPSPEVPPEARLVTHPRFGTGTVRIPGFHIDLITARSETYARPGALPAVKPATILEDLLRRDFTINALALRLNGSDVGEILDPTGGRRDLDAKLIRALHERSFQDDATRIVRATTYATRFDFEVETQTLKWLRRDTAYLRKISPARIHSTLRRVLGERDPATAARVFLQLDRLGTLEMIHRDLRFSRQQAKAMSEVRKSYEYFSLAGWVLLTWPESDETARKLSWRLRLSVLQREAIGRVPRLMDLRATLSRPGLKPSKIDRILRGFGGPELWPFAALEGGIVRDRVITFLKTRSTRPELDGNDLIALGIPPSKLIGDILERLRVAKLDGEVTTREDEDRLVRDLLQRQQQLTTDDR